MSTHSVARLLSEGSQIVDYFEEEKERIERNFWMPEYRPYKRVSI